MHIPVLLNKTIKYLDPKPGENFIDCTLGEAGHTKAILKKTEPNGKVLGIDADTESLKRIKLDPEIMKYESQGRLMLVRSNFKNIKKAVEENRFQNIKGVLFDLGLSSWQIEESKKGFTYKKDEPLIMILNGSQDVSAQEIINNWPEESLIGLFQKYAQERFSRRIVRGIMAQRKISPIKTTTQLKNIIIRAIPRSKTRRGKKDRVLARIFQALRIEVNDELENLKQGLEDSLEILDKEGRIAIISFHSLEDRIAKIFLREKAKEGKIEILTKKPIAPDEEEKRMNPRSRSAKLRVGIKI
ncbi:MAG: 16S rRNA (cytosine(1402)-N(4))-methyltransferase RsmH [Candidatus Portnoybacteria bacterium]|nr:16S rRNA (cytosine(1402)-N(4))-methyltransferase RsmH [Candidatus Portnoybacteria bacterium]